MAPMDFFNVTQSATDFTTLLAEQITTDAVDQDDSGGSGIPLILRIVFVCVGIVGSAGNSVVILVLAIALIKKENTTNILILNQACVDFSTSIQLIFIYSFSNVYVPPSGIWAEFLCRLWLSNGLLWVMFVVSTYNLVMMCLERFIAVSYPILYSTKLKKKAAGFMVGFAWIFAPLIHYYYPIWFDYNDHGTCQRRFNLNSAKVMGFVIILWEFFIPFTLMCIMYTLIVLMLRRKQNKIAGVDNHRAATNIKVKTVATSQQTNTATTPASGQRAIKAPAPVKKKPMQLTHQVRRNVTITLLAVFVMFGVCWMPNHMTFLLFSLGAAQLGTRWHTFTLFLAYMNMSINPFIYAWKYRQFQVGFKRLFCKHRNNDSLLDSTHTGGAAGPSGSPSTQRNIKVSSKFATHLQNSNTDQHNDLLSNNTNG